MTLNDWLNSKRETKELSKLVNCGLISVKVFFHHEIYLRFDALKKQGYNTEKAVFMCMEYFKVSRKTVFNAIRFIKQDI